MSALTTHILDISHGIPATGVKIRVLFTEEATSKFRLIVGERVTNKDGRTDQPLLRGRDFRPGYFRIIFEVADYFERLGAVTRACAFLKEVPVDFSVPDSTSRYHIPLLVSPYGYSTYRGS